MSVIAVTESSFKAEVLEHQGTVLVDLWAEWCGPCKRLSPMVDKIAEEMPEIKVCKVNVDEEPDLARQYGIMSIPTLLVFKNGELAEKSVGLVPMDKIKAMLV